ncbi:MAG: hypothetical protein KDB64_04305, partial [Solirubrobacterales bacterium]|nr:hypothetical protein [Solirubrobacterales bacterium]
TQDSGAVLSDDASVKVTRDNHYAAPSIYKATLTGRKLTVGFKSATRKGRVAVSLPGKSRLIGKARFRLGKAGKGKTKVKLTRRAARAIHKGKIRKVKVKVTSANGKTRVKTLRVKH